MASVTARQDAMMVAGTAGTSRRYWVFQIGFWGGYWLLNLIFATAYGYSALLINLTFALLSILMLGLTHLYSRVYRKWFPEKSIASISLHLLWLLPLSAMALQFILYGIIYSAFQIFPAWNGAGLAPASMGAFIVYSINTCIILIVWCLVYLLRAEWTRRRRAEREHWQNEVKLREVELQFLRSQINSHFLFNALNNIRALILEDAHAARQALTDLAVLLRGLMHNETKLTVALRDEIAWVKGYLALETLQFEQRLAYDLHVEDQVMDAQVPPMLLQTLVENAIKHGIARRRAGGIIRISAVALTPSRWQLLVENPTAELPASHQGNGIGLKNARDRLQAAFGTEASLDLVCSSTVIATANMPL
jgi:LytS/YehU family sensor histidine kinase